MNACYGQKKKNNPNKIKVVGDIKVTWITALCNSMKL